MDSENHVEFWHKVAKEAADSIRRLFSESGIELKSAIGKENIETHEDAEETLAFILCHGETGAEKARGMLSVCEWLHACDEIRMTK